jgi:uncharacterized protein
MLANCTGAGGRQTLCYARGMVAFDDLPLIDDHLHPPLVAEAVAARPFADFFTEADDPALLREHTPHTLFFGRALRDLAALLGCAPRVEEVVAARAALGPEALLRRCVVAGNVGALITDDGYTGGAEALTLPAMAAAAGVPVARVLRLETVAGTLAVEHGDLAVFDAALLRALDEARAAGAVALKSIAAYRCGLDFVQPSHSEAQAGLRLEHGRLTASAPRLTDRRLIFHTLALALTWAGALALPVQIHTGFGDRDLDLARANPALLRPLLEDARLCRGPIVLLHAGYPYAREAGYLASVYPTVYVDWSQANPLLAGPVLTRVLEELLALAPATKLLYGSDAWGIPDWIYLGALYGRAALAAALADDPDANAHARLILHDNAARLYGLA